MRFERFKDAQENNTSGSANQPEIESLTYLMRLITGNFYFFPKAILG